MVFRSKSKPYRAVFIGRVCNQALKKERNQGRNLLRKS